MATDALSLLFRLKATGGKEAAAEVGKLRSAVKSEISGIANDLAAATGRLGSFAAGLGPAGLGLAAVAGASVGLGAALFKLADHAAETGARLHDISIETGLSVETLSALELQLKQSGSSLEGLSNATFLLQKNLAEAAKSGKDFGVGISDPKAALSDMDGTLKTVINSLGKMTDVGVRNAEGARVMGRGYKDLRVFISDVDGDLESVIEQSRKAGFIMSKEAAQGADTFKDNLDALGFTAGRLTDNLGNRLIPEINKLFNVMISGSTSAGSVMGAVFEGVAFKVRGLTNEILVMLAALKTVGSLPAAALVAATGPGGVATAGGFVKESFNTNLAGIMTDALKAPVAMPKPAFGGLTGGGGGKGKGAGGGKKDEALRREQRALQLSDQEFEAAHREATERIQREYDLREISLEEFTNKEKAELQEWLAAKEFVFTQEEELIRRSTKNAAERAEKLREIAIRRQETQAEFESRTLKLEDDLAAEVEKVVIARAEGLARIKDAQAERETARLREQADLRLMTVEEVEGRIGMIELAAFDRESALISARAQEARVDSEERQRLLDEEAARQSERAALVEETERRIRAAKAETARVEAEENYRKFQQRGEFDTKLAEPQSMGDVFGNVGTSISESFGLMGENAESMGQTMAGAFGAVTSGFQNMIQGFLMGEKLSGAAFAKMAKAAIASVAAEAAVRALFEVGMGLASMFFNPLAAAGHFAAAKAFGAVALVAGATALALPGGGSSAGGVAGPAFAGAGQGPATSNERNIRTGRRGGSSDPNAASSIPVGDLNLKIDMGDGVVEQKVVRIWNAQGKLRATLRGDILGEPQGA